MSGRNGTMSENLKAEIARNSACRTLCGPEDGARYRPGLR